MNLYLNQVQIGKDIKTVVTVNQEKTAEEIQEVVVKQIHHILLLDRSGSMRWDIANLIEDVKQCFKYMGKKDYISIIWFSTAGQFRTLIKAARKTDQLNDLLDTIKSTVLYTCFSDPIREAQTIIDELKTVCPNFSVSLFTDGLSETPWSREEESQRVKDLVTKMSLDIIAFNTIGYGNYYNQSFMREVAELSQFGSFIHTSDVRKFAEIFDKNYQKIQEITTESVKIKHNGPKLYLNRKFSKLVTTPVVKLDNVDNNKNQFFLIGDDHFKFEYNGVEYKTKDIKEQANAKTIDNFLYAMAFNRYYADDYKGCFDILFNNLRDKYLLDSQSNAFTVEERKEHLDKLELATFKTSGRYFDGKCGDNYAPADDAFCVMDMLSVLIADNAYLLPYHEDADAYTKIGKETTHSKWLFNWFDKNNFKVPFNNFTTNKTKLNLSLLMAIPGYVELEKADAKILGSSQNYHTTMFRNYNLINDGCINIRKMVCILPKKTVKFLRDNGVKMSPVDVDKDIIPDGYVAMEISLRKLPILNTSYVNKSQSIANVFDKSFKVTELQYRQKVINWYIKQLVTSSIVGSIPQEHVDILAKYGINDKGIYNGFPEPKKSNDECDSYLVREMEFKFKGLSSIPSVDDLLKRIASNKVTTYPLQMLNCQKNMVDIALGDKNLDIKTNPASSLEYLNIMLADVKLELTMLRNELNAIKMAKVLTNDWFPNLQKDDKGNEYFERNDKIMYLKTKKTEQYY